MLTGQSQNGFEYPTIFTLKHQRVQCKELCYHAIHINNPFRCSRETKRALFINIHKKKTLNLSYCHCSSFIHFLCGTLFSVLFSIEANHNKSKEEGNDHESICTMTRDTVWESDITQENNTQKSQEASPLPAGDHKAARKRQDSITKTNMKHK